MSSSKKPLDLEHVLQVLRDNRAKKYELLHVSKPGDAGFNLIGVETVIIPPGLIPPVEIPTGIRIKLPRGMFARIEPRSSMYSAYPMLVLCSAPIDNGYTGPLGPRFRNLGSVPAVVAAGDALVQLVLYPLSVPEVVEVDELPETARGADRYGSTGK